MVQDGHFWCDGLFVGFLGVLWEILPPWERNGVWVEHQKQASHVVMDHAGSLVKRAVVAGGGIKQVGWCRSK